VAPGGDDALLGIGACGARVRVAVADGDVGALRAERPSSPTLAVGLPPFRSEREETMAQMVKVIEVLAQSETSWDDAAKVALAEASKTIDNIKSIYVKDMQAVVENDRIVAYRITAKISFVLAGDR
jgi:hypothetical protein